MPLPSIRGLLFDKDGTLFDFYRSWGPVTEAAALMIAGGDADKARFLMQESGKDKVTGRYIPGSPIASGSNLEIAEMWAGLLGRADVKAIHDAMHQLFLARQVAAAHPVTDLDPFFARLRLRGLVLGIATMDSEQGARETMERFGVHQVLDFICGFDTGHGVKPGGGMVAAFARHMKLPPAAIAVVGDSPHDMEMARAGGAGHAIGVLTGVSPREALEASGADLVLDSIAEIEAIL